MLSSAVKLLVESKLSHHYPRFNKSKFSSVGGGSINQAYQVDGNGLQFFCKVNSATKFPRLFELEKNGLEYIAKQNIIRTPAVIECFENDGNQLLILEWINEGHRNKSFWEKFGEQLAALHHLKAEYFGFIENNYMGSIPQSNRHRMTWNEFFIHERLEPLVSECNKQGLLDTGLITSFQRLYKHLPEIFDDHPPVLLHGDLWSGNFMCDENANPVLIDTAVYYGHPSVDLGMTTLFGGFSKEFYESYNYHKPFPKNYKQQWAVCNLYPLLIHLLLFGGSYLKQIRGTVEKMG